ncbi:hypothetical protein [Actinomadura livida]|uniref:Lipoprotein n=1 Tax=Actinomadura livida TaxID=79909 RepID=A0A7W7MVS9_9ACTN|nr:MULTISPECIES: hypothetical protein [Actinomadura]MBB4772926.1 hypothetical protein [Actinomadura catellatispora]GGU13717.1 hypothetical protein GCM10010208_43440 [Actinomadura livida]
MIRNSRRMVALAVAGAVAIAPVISGCGAGMDAQSAAPVRLTEGVNVSVPLDDTAPQVVLRNMFVLGPKPEVPIPQGASLPLYGVLINQVPGREDRLTSVSSPQFGSAMVKGGGITLPPAARDGSGSLVMLRGDATVDPGPEAPETAQPTATPEPTGPGSTASPTASPTSQNTAGPTIGAPTPPTGQGQPVVVLNGLRDPDLIAGGLITVRMQFEKAGAVEFKVPLILQQDEYSTYPLVTPNGQAPASPGATNGNQQSPGTEPAQPGASPSPSGAESPSPTGTESPAAGGH